MATRSTASTLPQVRSRSSLTGRSNSAYLYLLPGLAFIVLTTVIGLAYSIYISFTNFDGLNHFDHWDWVGLRNYRDVLLGTDVHTFVMLAEWTVSFAALTTVLSFVVGLGLALLLNDRRLRERSIYRTLLIVPWALPATISILAFSGIFNDDFGYLNMILGHLGLGNVPWFGSPWWAKTAVLLVNTWLAFPFMMTACLGALQSVPNELDEAAVVDGASAPSRFRYVTLPFLRPVITPLLIGVFAFQFNNFNVIYLLTSGNPAISNSDAGGTDILITYTYKLVLTQQRFAVAATYTMVMFVIVAVIGAVQAKASGAFVEAKTG
jgi:arabinogalactan oligomer/maltooligosaccharide transport system permease protein